MTPIKLAILIAGEYRTFAECRRTMKFLDQFKNSSEVFADIYFSTWNKTRTTNTIGGFHDVLDVKKSVSSDEISNLLGTDAHIQVIEEPMSHPPIPPLWKTWMAGSTFLKSFNIEYDYVFILRPDLFFDENATLSLSNMQFNAELYEDFIGIHQLNLIPHQEIPDVCFFLSYKNFKKIFSDTFINDISLFYNKETPWHRALYYFIVQFHNLQLVRIPITVDSVIARFSTEHDWSYKEVKKHFFKLHRDNFFNIGLVGDFKNFKTSHSKMNVMRSTVISPNILIVNTNPTPSIEEITASIPDLYYFIIPQPEVQLEDPISNRLHAISKLVKNFWKDGIILKPGVLFDNNVSLDHKFLREVYGTKYFSISMDKNTNKYTDDIVMGNCEFLNILFPSNIHESWLTYYTTKHDELNVIEIFNDWWDRHVRDVIDNLQTYQFVNLPITQNYLLLSNDAVPIETKDNINLMEQTINFDASLIEHVNVPTVSINDVLNTHRVALVACGCLRTFSHCYPSWNVFQNQHNYVHTWETDWIRACKLIKERDDAPLPSITKIYDLVNAKNTNHIIDYEIFKDFSLKQSDKSPFLWSMLENYISYDYDYVCITRPDLALQKVDEHIIEKNYRLPEENEIQTIHVDHNQGISADYIFFMRRSTYSKFSEIYNYVKHSKDGSIHHSVYQFCKQHDIKLTDMFRYYVSTHFYRQHATINKNNILQIEQEEIRCFDMCWQPKVQSPQDELVVILLISNNILSENDKRKYFDLGIKKYNEKCREYKNKNISYRCFESTNVSVGIEKINRFFDLYGMTVNHIEIVKI